MIQKQMYSMDEFCKSHSISRSTFYRLIREGNAPEYIKVGTKTLISIEAAEKWRNNQINIETQ